MKTMIMTLTVLLSVVLVIANAATASDSPPATPAFSGGDQDYQPVVTHMTVGNLNTWKTSEHYDFLYVDGFLGIYNPGEQVEFSVEGKSDKLTVEKTNGFDVAATIIDLSENMGTRLDVRYNNDRRTWQFKFAAPNDSGKEYKIVLNLFCRKPDSQCATSYGFGTQVDKVLTLQVR